MASSGSFQDIYSSTSRIKFALGWHIIEQSVEDNTSTIGIWTVLEPQENYFNLSCYYSITVGPQTQSNTIMCGSNGQVMAGNSYMLFGTDEFVNNQIAPIVVPHDADGTKNLEISFTLNFGTYMGTINYSTSVELDPIPRSVSILSAPNFTDEQSPTITFTNPAGSSATSLTAQITSEDGTKVFATRSVSKTATSYTFTLSSTEKQAIWAAAPNSKTLNVKFKLTGVIGDTTSTAESLKTCTIVDSHPSLSATIEDTNSTTIALTGNKNTLIRYCSNAKYTLTPTVYKSATVKSVTAEHGSTKLTTTTGTFNAVENGTFKFSVVDSRSNLTARTVECTIVNYVKLTCDFEHSNPTTDGNMTFTISGNYFNGSFGATSNTLAVQYRYKVDGDDDYGAWITVTPTISNNTYSIELSLSGMDYQTGYTFQARAADKINPNYVNSVTTYTKSLPVFHWGREDFVFEVPVTFNAGATGLSGGGGDAGNNIEGDCNITGDLRLKGDANYGNALYFGENQYCYLKEATDDNLTIHASDIILDSDNVLINDVSHVTVDSTYVDINATVMKINGHSIVVGGTWTPKLNNDLCVTSYDVQSGWYSRIGNVVIIGFMVQAYFDSGYSSTYINVTGVPFTPAFDTSITVDLYKESGTSMSTPSSTLTLSTTGTITTSEKYGSSDGYVSFEGIMTYITA